MDCLDRTNVVQSVVSRWALNRQLRDIGILGNDDRFENFTDFEFLFRNGKISGSAKLVSLNMISWHS